MRRHVAWSTPLIILTAAHLSLLGSAPALAGTLDPTPVASTTASQQNQNQGTADPSPAALQDPAPPTPPADPPADPPGTAPTDLPTEQPPDPGVPTPSPVPTTPTQIPAPAPMTESLPVEPSLVSPAPDADMVPVPSATAATPASRNRVTSPVAEPPANPDQLLPAPPAGVNVESDDSRATLPGAVQRGAGPAHGSVLTNPVPLNGSPMEVIPAPTVDANPVQQPRDAAASPERSPDMRDGVREVVIAALSIVAIILGVAIAIVSRGRRGPTMS